MALYVKHPEGRWVNPGVGIQTIFCGNAWKHFDSVALFTSNINGTVRWGYEEHRMPMEEANDVFPLSQVHKYYLGSIK